MTNKIILTIVVLALIVAGIAYFGRPGAPGSPVATGGTPSEEVPPNGQPAENPNTPPAPSEQTGQVVTIIYTDRGFSPMTSTVKKGTIVNFLNQSTRPFWPASADHPSHKKYPTSGGCIGSTFDACQSLPKGTGWTFQFNEVGTWEYHDHLAPDFGGKVVVQ